MIARQLMPCLLVTMLALSACGGPATAGKDEVIGGLGDDVPGEMRTAVLPTGTLEITVGAPLKRLEAADTRDSTERRAPAGSSFLPVHWHFDASAAPLSGLLSKDPQNADVHVIVADQERSLPSPYEVKGSALATNPSTTAYIVVPGDPRPEDVDVSVAYDDALQVLAGDGSVSGPGSGLAELVGAEPESVSCPATGWDAPAGIRADVICDALSVAVTPYWPGSGWAAEAGNDWTVVTVPRLGVSRIEKDGASYSVDTVRGSAGGQDLVGSTFPDSVDGVVVSPDADSLELRLEVTGSLTRGRGPLEVAASLSHKVSLR